MASTPFPGGKKTKFVVSFQARLVACRSLAPTTIRVSLSLSLSLCVSREGTGAIGANCFRAAECRLQSIPRSIDRGKRQTKERNRRGIHPYSIRLMKKGGKVNINIRGRGGKDGAARIAQKLSIYDWRQRRALDNGQRCRNVVNHRHSSVIR